MKIVFRHSSPDIDPENVGSPPGATNSIQCENIFLFSPFEKSLAIQTLCNVSVNLSG